MHKSTSEFLTESRTRRDNLISALAGTFASEQKPMMPIIAARPLRISDLRPRAFDSAPCSGNQLKGSYRLNWIWPPTRPLMGG